MRSLPSVGRGATYDPRNRFEPLEVALDEAETHHDAPRLTRYLLDHSRSVIATNDSPDVPLDAGVNPYRGCEHGCAYCYARPTHEYLGFSAGLDFESRILVKRDAAALLRRRLSSGSWTPQPVMMSGVTDPYQPAERALRITRSVLEVLHEFRNPVAVITKNHLVTRDADLLSDMATDGAASAALSITSLSRDLQRSLEPRASTPSRRLRAIEALAERGVPVAVSIAPVIPGLTDHEVPEILQAAANAGATSATYIVLRLPRAVGPIFDAWLRRAVPDRREKILERLRSLHGGELYRSRWHARGRGSGPYAQQLASLFDVARRKLGLTAGAPALSTDAFRRPHDRRGQGELF